MTDAKTPSPMIDFNQASFLMSSSALKNSPPDEGVEIAFVGRSNSGKSSAINAITNKKSMARTSKQPGRTQLINYFTLTEEYKLVDLPGYGYAKVNASIQQQIERLLNEYLHGRKCCRGLILLMDIRHPLTSLDETLLNFALAVDIPVHILLTKCDKLGRGAAMQSLFAVQKQLKHLFPQVTTISVQIFSALKKTGLDDCRALLSEWYTK